MDGFNLFMPANTGGDTKNTPRYAIFCYGTQSWVKVHSIFIAWPQEHPQVQEWSFFRDGQHASSPGVEFLRDRQHASSPVFNFCQVDLQHNSSPIWLFSRWIARRKSSKSSCIPTQLQALQDLHSVTSSQQFCLAHVVPSIIRPHLSVSTYLCLLILEEIQRTPLGMQFFATGRSLGLRSTVFS